MIKTRIAGAATILTIGLAALGGTVVAIAAPAGAATETVNSPDNTSMRGTAAPAVADARQLFDERINVERDGVDTTVPAPGSAASEEHVPFPHTPHNPHEGQGHKGKNERPHPIVPRIHL